MKVKKCKQLKIICLIVSLAYYIVLLYLQFLLGLSTGGHLKYPNVEMIPVLAFRLEPMCKGSHIVVDGEVLGQNSNSPVVQAEIFPGLISLFNRHNSSKELDTAALRN